MMRRLFLLALPLLAFSATLATSPLQQPALPDDKSVPASKIERKNLAPVSKDVLSVKLPKATENTLSNGLTVLIIEDHRLPLVEVQLNMSAAGPIFEPANMPGLAGTTATMLREGTKSRTSVQIANDVAALGASLGSSSGFGSSATVITASGLSDNFEQWFAIATDILMNPTFPADELNRLKARQKVQLTQQRAAP